jgi:hypothetical protein
MQKRRLKLPVAIVWWEVLVTSVISWIVKKFLDFIWTHGKVRIRSSQMNLPLELIQTFERLLLHYYVTAFFSCNPSSSLVRLPIFPDIVKVTLRIHRKMHREGTLKTETCQYCRIIMYKKAFMERFAPNPKLYPPFK